MGVFDRWGDNEIQKVEQQQMEGVFWWNTLQEKQSVVYCYFIFSMPDQELPRTTQNILEPGKNNYNHLRPQWEPPWINTRNTQNLLQPGDTN